VKTAVTERLAKKLETTAQQKQKAKQEKEQEQTREEKEQEQAKMPVEEQEEEEEYTRSGTLCGMSTGFETRSAHPST